MQDQLLEAEQVNTFVPTDELAELFVDLLNLPQGACLLVVEMTVAITQYAQSRGYEVIRVDASQQLEQQVSAIKKLSPVDGALLTPYFGTRPKSVPLPHGWQDVKTPASEDALIAHAVARLKPTGALAAVVPQGLLNNYRRIDMRQALLRHGLALVAAVEPSLVLKDSQRFSVATAIIVARCDHAEESRSLAFADLSSADEFPPLEVWRSVLDGNANDGWTRVEVNKLGENLRLDPQYYDPSYLQIKAPPGYIELLLNDIADIKGGIHIDDESRYDEQSEKHDTPYLQVRHILGDGQISPKCYWVDAQQFSRRSDLLARPGDILVTAAGTIGKTAIVPEKYQQGVLFDTTIRALRIDPKNSARATVEMVYQFLRSEIGQAQLRRQTSGSAIPVLVTPMLASVQIFVPVLGDVPDGTVEADSVEQEPEVLDAHIWAATMQTKIVDYLRSVDSRETNWRMVIEPTMKQIMDQLFAKPLDKIILDEFPAPIAIPFRRFNMADHNPYERLTRMVSLVESCIYFTFNVLLADYCRNDRLKRIALTKPARQAVKGSDAIYDKLVFISDVINGVQDNPNTLFVTEFASNTAVHEIGDKFRQEVRNVIAHTAPGSEPYVRSLIAKYRPSLYALLESLVFLKDYRLCRVRNFSYQNSRLQYQMEVYSGAEYDVHIREEPGQDGTDLLRADREHLVLLRAGNDVLDLYPFFQLYFGNETCREPHFFFVKGYKSYEDKQTKENVRRLIGESTRNGMVMDLPGVTDFFRLVSATGQVTSSDLEAL